MMKQVVYDRLQLWVDVRVMTSLGFMVGGCVKPENADALTPSVGLPDKQRRRLPMGTHSLSTTTRAKRTVFTRPGTRTIVGVPPKSMPTHLAASNDSGSLHARIQARACELYKQRGFQEDHAHDDCGQAEREIGAPGNLEVSGPVGIGPSSNVCTGLGIRTTGFLHYNGGMHVRSSLLNIVLHN